MSSEFTREEQPAQSREDEAVRKAWARFSNALHRSPDAPYPGMSEAFEKHFSQSFTDRAYLKARAEAVGGATLRDYFAAKAMQGLLAHHGVYEEEANHFSLCSKKEARRRESSVPVDWVAEYAYRTADAMLEARKEKP